MTKIIGISGKSQNGKDTLGTMLKCYNPKYADYEIVRFGDTLKKMCAILLNVNPSKMEEQKFKASVLNPIWWVYEVDDLFGGKTLYPYLENKNEYPSNCLRKTTVRDLLQLTGTECFRNIISPNTWLNALKERYTKNSKWIITDIRFQNEVNFVKELNGKNIRILRPMPNLMYHPSEFALDDYDKWDLIIQNDGTLDELKEKAKKIDL